MGGRGMTDFTFRTPAHELTEAQIIARYPGLPEGWAAADDVALWEGLFRGIGFEDMAVKHGKRAADWRARFFAFRDAAGGGPLPLKAQTVFLQEARRRAAE